MGRHAESGSDGLNHGGSPVAGGRRRTDLPDGLWGGAPVGGSEAPRQVSRSRLPLPPVPTGPAGPRTSAAPFRAVPAPELPGGPAGDGRVHAGGGSVDHAARIAAKAGVPVLPRPARAWPDDEPALVSTGPALSASGPRASGPAPRLPRQTTPAGAPSPAYGDWTKPSRPSEPLDLDFAADASGQFGLRVPAAPATSAIPERPVRRRGRSLVDEEPLDSAAYDTTYADGAYADAPYSDEFPVSEEFPASEEFSARGPQTGPGTGSVGGRAAKRAERQAMEMARRKAAKRSGEPVGIPDDEETTGRRPRRVLMGLVAMVVVALGVLGVYTVISPQAQEAASGSTATQSSAPSAASSSAVLPPLETGDLEVEVAPVAPATPVHAPVTVLNATDINGLAADVSALIAAGGWETPGVGTYLADDIATSTVFYTEGDETQRQAAESLKAQFPQLQTAAVRFFEVPADVAAPGLVVVLTAEWQP